MFICTSRRLAARARGAVAAVVLTAVAAALAIAAGGSALAATRPAAATTVVTWHRLTLRNGWQSSQGQWGSGSPSWAVRNGTVYLSGSLHQASGTSPEFAVLPKAARPSHRQYIQVYTNGFTVGHIDVFPSGLLDATSNPVSDSQAFTSLAGVSFPAAGMTLHKLRLVHGWASSQAVWQTGAPSYWVTGGVVHMSGAMHGGNNAEFAVLPAAARPAHLDYIPIYTSGDTSGTVTIPGKLAAPMQVFGANVASFTSLAGVSFPASGLKSHSLTLVNGWKSEGHGCNCGSPAWSLSGGVVSLSGVLQQPGGGNSEFAVLPKAARPKHYMWIAATTEGGTVGGVEIKPNGVMIAYNKTPAWAQAFTSLAGISYPVNS